MLRTTLYTLVFLTALLTACKKEKLPPQDEESPEFYLKCDVNNVPLTLTAGNDGYYMGSSWWRDSTTNLNVFKADIRQNNCTGCGYSVSVLINDGKISAAADPMMVEKALSTGAHLFNDVSFQPSEYKATLTPLKNAEGTYSWQASDGKNMVLASTFSHEMILPAGKKYDVTLKYENHVGTCSISHANEFRIGNPLQGNISALRAGGLDLRFNFSYVSTRKPSKCTWDFGDASPVSDAWSPTHTYAVPGNYRVKLTMIDAMSDTCIAYYSVNTASASDCDANFNAAFTPIQNPKLFSSVTFIITAPDGTVYSSKDITQPASSHFEIVSVSEYVANEKGQPTKRVNMRFNCVVKNGPTVITITNGEAVFAMAYKN